MRINGLFITRPHDPESLELLTAWDDISIDENPTGYQADLDRALRSVGDDVLNHAIVTIDVDSDKILEIVNKRGVVPGTVVATR